MAVSTLTASMIMVSTLILFSLLHALTEMHVSDREGEECNCYSNPKHVLHIGLQINNPNCTIQNFTRMAMEARSSVFRRSGNHPGIVVPGIPLFPPGGVTPPGPLQYGTFACR